MTDPIAKIGSMRVMEASTKGKGTLVRLKVFGVTQALPAHAAGVDGEGFFLELGHKELSEWKTWLERL